MLELRKIVETNISTVNCQTHAYVAMNLLVKENVTGLPVLGDEGQVVGIVTEKDFLSLLVSHEDIDDKVVSDFMTRDVTSFDAGDSAVDLCDYFLERPIRMVPVTENGKYIGVVRRREIIYLILLLRGKIYTKHKGEKI